MADRYWVGGTAAWDGTAGTKWSTTSGGGGGASVPTSADDVFFTNLSSGTCTISSGNTGAKSINCTGFTGTLAGNAVIIVSGSVTLDAGMTFTYNGTMTLNGTGTLTSAGKTFGPVNISGSGITVTLGGALNIGGNTLTVTQGTLDTANYNLTASVISSANSNVRTITLGSSTLTLSGSTPIGFSTNTNLTFNAGTSTINATAAGPTIAGGAASATGVTFYNVAFAAGGSGIDIRGINTFNDFTVAAQASAGVRQVTFDSRQTINGTLSTSGTAGNRRVWFRGVTYGIAQTLTINATPSLTDADFRDIYVIGTAAPISGTRVGDLRGCRGITFDTPKTVYWNLAAGGNWSANAWAASSGAGVSTDNFPLAQDTAVIENTGLNTSATVTIDSAFSYTGALSTQTRTNAFTLGGSNSMTFYGDLTLSSAVTLSYNGTITFSGRNIQTVTSAGKAFNSNLVIDSYGGRVELGDAFSVSGNNLTITNGTFDTKNYNVTAGSLASSNSNVRAITLGSSTVTLSGTGVAFNTSVIVNLTFNAGTSQLNMSSTASNITLDAGGLTLYNVSFTGASSSLLTHSVIGTNTFNNLTLTASTSAGLTQLALVGNQTITGTLTVAGATAVRRIFVRSNTLGTTRTLTVGTLSADDCDFRDITIAGTAAGSSPTRAGDCGGNSGITFPAAKTVYWNLAGAQNWSATAWAPGSGGSPDINNFPLAQDTAVFDNTGSAGTVTVQTFNVGTLDTSTRTTAMTLSVGLGQNPTFYGSLTSGTGLTFGGARTVFLSGRTTQTITSNGVSFGGWGFTIDCDVGTVQLGDALDLSAATTLTLTSGTFDAVTYNVTTGLFSQNTNIGTILKMGSGTWTLSGTGSVWNYQTTAPPTAFYKGTADIVLSDTSTTARTFAGGGLSYNKLTIGGTTGTSTLTITGNNQFTELASTKTVAHTIALGTTTQTFGKWTVTGTVGNVVTLTGTGTAHILAGACTDSIDYLAMGSIGFAATSPGEFYAGANSTGTAAAPVYRTAKPADSTRYWVGGTGNWSDTARWSTSSGGASGAAVPRSHDDVVFDSLSNATAYTATVNAVTGGIRCKALTIAGPLVGNVTLAGSTAIVGIHGNVTLPATGLTRTYTGAITLSGSTSGLTLTTNGVALASSITLDGVGCEWVLGSALDLSTVGGFTLVNGVFDCVTYNLTCGGITCSSSNIRTFDFGSGTITTSGSSGAFAFGTTETTSADLTIVAGTAQINCTGSNPTFSGNGKTFYNVAFTNTSAGTVTLNGANTFNDLSFTGITSTGLKIISVTANQTITGTFTCSAGTNATRRHIVRSNIIGTTRTLTCAAVSLTDVDFRDITIAGVAAPATGTRIGDCKGNSGITFTAAANKYWNLAAGGNWGGSIGWATSSGGTPNINDFPLAQDTCFFEATGLNSGATITVNQDYNIGTIDMSARTTNTMTLGAAAGATIYGNWINGTGTTLTGTGTLIFVGRGSQTITSAGKIFTQGFTIDNPTGSVTLQDAFQTNFNSATALIISAGTFNAVTYNVTLSGATSSLRSFTSSTRTVGIGSGTWTIAGSGNAVDASTSTNLTVTGTGTISLTSASAKTFAGGSASYSGITLNQGGAGTLTISGNNTFANITNTYKATGATTIAFGTTTQRVGNFTAAGEAGRVLTLTGTSAASPATLVLTSGTVTTPDYLTITGIRAYDLNTTWYAGANSTNNGSLGWLFEAAGGTTFNVSFSDTATGDDALSAACIFLSATSESATGSDTATVAGSTFNTLLSETATGQDTTSATATFNASLTDTTTGSDTISAGLVFAVSLSDTATGADAISAGLVFAVSLSDTATGADTFSAVATLGAAFSDTATGADASSVVASVFGAQTAETAGIQDTLTVTASLSVALSDAASLVDSPTTLVDFTSSFADTAVASDGIAAGYAVLTVVSESATGADAFVVAASVFTPSFTDTVTGTDAVVVLASSFSAEVSDIVVGTDAPDAAGSVFGSSLSDTATLFDLPSVAASAFGAALSDTVTGADAPAAVVIFPVSFSDTATGADALAAQMSFATSLSETATLSDTAAVAASIFNPAVQELALALDIPAVAASTFGAVLNETVQAQDVPAALMVFPVSFSDTATAADALAAQMVFATAVAELATGSDATSVLVIFVSSVSETASGLDAPAVAASTFNASFSASAIGQGTPAVAGSTFNVSLSETGAITDVVVGGYLWNPIDDTQSANWQNVVDAQSAGWTSVNDAQSAGWVQVTDAQSPGWVQINDAQGPNWVEIQT
jgi:hypothetical protein